MKNILILTIAIISFVSCGVKEGEYKIEGTIKGLVDDTKLYINIQDEANMSNKTIDTAQIKDGKFTFEGKLPENISLATLTVEGQPVNQMFILENGKIVLTIDKDSTHLSKIGGTANNEYFQTYNEKMNDFQKKGMKFQKDNMEKIAQAQQNPEIMEELMKAYEPLKNEMESFNEEFIGKNPKAYIGLMLMKNMVMNPEADMDKAKSLFDKMDKSLKDSKIGKDLTKQFEEISKLAIGKKAPDFTSKTAEEVEFKLSENLGKVTLIDFWASWCGPCRQENPNVVGVYNDYKDKGLKIIGVSLDQDKTKWLEAVKADKLTWDHVAQLDPQNDVAAKLYNVASIPSTFLLDEKGNIIAKNLRGNALREKIAELLN